MCVVLPLIRIRRLVRNRCSPMYLGYVFQYCTSCGEEKFRGSQYLSNAVLIIDVYHVSVKCFKSFFLFGNVNLVATACVLDYLDHLGRYITSLKVHFVLSHMFCTCISVLNMDGTMEEMKWPKTEIAHNAP